MIKFFLVGKSFPLHNNLNGIEYLKKPEKLEAQFREITKKWIILRTNDRDKINDYFSYASFINNVVTPDNNGENDTWVIKNIETFELSNVYIYDRYGKEIYSKKGYKNDWDASSNFDQVPDGTYYYIINFDDNDKVYKGSITVLRN